jgi:hypothetical protein
MRGSRVLFAQFLVALLLAVLMWVAVWQFLYWRLWWFDIPMHVLGGVWASLCIAWLLARRGETVPIVWCLLFTLAIGGTWELFEYSEGITFPQYMSYPADTLKDLTMDLVGAVLGWVLADKVEK